MIIQNLIEDTQGKNGCLYEHGLSFYMETKRHKILMDTGATSDFLENAEKLGIDLTKVDTVFLSHGHYDHGGGIIPFSEINNVAKIYMRDSALDDYYSERTDGLHYAGLDKRIEELPQIVLLNGDCIIDEELFLFTNITGRRLWPQGNLKLKQMVNDELVQDEFLHEQCLIVACEGKEILFSGCAHNGILNILDKYKELRGREPDAVVSGFHMVKASPYSEQEIETIRQTAYELKKYGTKFFTGHCTGEIAFRIMKEILGEQIIYVRSGEQIVL